MADTVMGTVTKSLGKQPFYPDYTDFLVTTDAIHAERRAHEMDMVIQTMQDVGVEPTMTRATAEVIHWTAGLGLKEHFKGEVPPNWRVVVAEILGGWIRSRARSKESIPQRTLGRNYNLETTPMSDSAAGVPVITYRPDRGAAIPAHQRADRAERAGDAGQEPQRRGHG